MRTLLLPAFFALLLVAPPAWAAEPLQLAVTPPPPRAASASSGDWSRLGSQALFGGGVAYSTRGVLGGYGSAFVEAFFSRASEEEASFVIGLRTGAEGWGGRGGGGGALPMEFQLGLWTPRVYAVLGAGANVGARGWGSTTGCSTWRRRGRRSFAMPSMGRTCRSSRAGSRRGGGSGTGER